MTTLDLNTRTLARMLELKQKLEFERRNKVTIKTQTEQKTQQDFFNRQLQIKLRPLNPLQNKNALSQKEVALQLSKQLRTTHTPNSFPLKKLQTHEEHRKQLLQALKKIKHHKHAKKHRLEQLTATRVHANQEIEAQQRRTQLRP